MHDLVVPNRFYEKTIHSLYYKHCRQYYGEQCPRKYKQLLIPHHFSQPRVSCQSAGYHVQQFLRKVMQVIVERDLLNPPCESPCTADFSQAWERCLFQLRNTQSRASSLPIRNRRVPALMQSRPRQKQGCHPMLRATSSLC